MPSSSDIENTSHQLMTVLPQFNRMMASELRQEVDEFATLSQFRVLAYLNEQPMTVTALAKMRRVSLQSAGELVQSFVERGWITRTPDPSDRRQYILQLTDEGRANYQRAQGRMLHQLNHYLEQLTDAELQTVREALTALQRVIMSDSGAPTNDDR